MALFGSVGKFVSHVIHNPAFQVAFPVVAAGSLLGERGLHKISGVLSQFDKSPAQPTQDHQLNSYYPYPTYPVAQPYQYGGAPWDYSIQSQGFSTLPVGQVTQDYLVQQLPSSQMQVPPGWFP